MESGEVISYAKKNVVEPENITFMDSNESNGCKKFNSVKLTHHKFISEFEK